MLGLALVLVRVLVVVVSLDLLAEQEQREQREDIMPDLSSEQEELLEHLDPQLVLPISL